MPDVGRAHSQFDLILKRKRKRKLVEIDELDRIEFFIDRALHHPGDYRTADARRAGETDTIDLNATKEFLRGLVEDQLHRRVCAPAKFNASDQRRTVISGESNGSLYSSITKPNRRAY